MKPLDVVVSMQVSSSRSFKVALGLALLTPAIAAAQPCTDGVDCLCDRVEGRGPLGTSDPAYVVPAQRVTCIDWEEATLASTASTLPITSDTINAGGENVGRPWDATGSECSGTNRGGGSWFTARYGNGHSGLWQFGEPASPARGVTCGCGPPFQGCTGTRAFHPTNFWGAGNKFALAIRRPGEETGFEPAHSLVPIAFGNQDAALISEGGSGYSMVPPSESFDITHLGFTAAIVYSENYLTQINGSGDPVGSLPIKGDEFSPGDFWFFGRQGNSPIESFPFSGFFFYGSAGDSTACNGFLASGQLKASVGIVNCVETAVVWHASTAYNQATHWPVGTKGCVRAELMGIASGAMRLREWFQHTTRTTETLVLDVTLNVPADFLNFTNVTRPWFDTYTNGLDQPGPAPDGKKHYRIEDNIVAVQNRPPVTCAQIGFAAQPSSSPPKPPKNLTVR